MRKCILTLSLGVVLLGFAGCGLELADDEQPYVRVARVTLSQTTLALKVGDEATLSVAVVPADATATERDWDTDNPEVAMVSSTGKVTAVGVGRARVWCLVGGQSGECIVTVR